MGGEPVRFAAMPRAEALTALRPWYDRGRAFTGWAFPDLGLRTLDGEPPWEYAAEVRAAGATATAAIDLGTGGGERLAGMRPALPTFTLATEEWATNVPIAAACLTPVGVPVLAASSLHLPFRDGTFDLVLSRHEAIDPPEIVRVLRSGGLFLTQQVGHDDWDNALVHLRRRHHFPDHGSDYSRAFREAGFAVSFQAHRTRVAFPSLAEFVYMLALTPWSVPGFSLARDLDDLLAAERACLGPEGFVVDETRYLLSARKPA